MKFKRKPTKEQEFADLFSQYTKDINQLIMDRERVRDHQEKQNITNMIIIAQEVITRLAKKLPK